MNVMELIENVGVLPVINITDISTAVPLANALVKGGIPVVEVTLRSEVSLNAIKTIVKEVPECKVLAGTILTVEQAKSAIDAGVSGLVMPGYDEEIVDFAMKNNMPIVPGCVTAADIQKGVKQGLKVFKFFPAEKSGGIDAIKLLSGPFKGIKFLPTGGIDYSNLGTYLKEKCVIACGGSYMANAKLLASKDFEAITANCKKAVDISLGFELAHIGINHNSEDEAVNTAETVSDIFRMNARYMNSAVFAGTAVEAVKSQGYGTKGHVGFFTNSMKRAMAYLKAKGIELNEDSIKRDASGEITCIYLNDEIAGFAFHIVSR